MTGAAPASPPARVVRAATPGDMAAVAAIYAPEVETGLATFEEVAPSVAELSARRDEIVRRGLPYLVAELAGQVVGFSYAGPFRTRPAYRYTVEDAVYVAAEARGAGVGRALLDQLIERCTLAGRRQMIAVIGDTANLASIALHRKAGFTMIGTLPATGFKLGRWVDTVHMQRALGPGATTPPDVDLAGGRGG